MHKLAWAALVAASFSVQADDLMPMDQPLESMDKVRGAIRYLGNATNGLRMCFVVQAPFEFAGVSFKVGDLIEYARKHPKVQQPFAYRFRHLQRLP